MSSVATIDVLIEVKEEREKQDEKWGPQSHPDGTGLVREQAEEADEARKHCDYSHKNGFGTWYHILREEFCEAGAESDPALLRTELIHTAAVAVAWIEAIDRRDEGPGDEFIAAVDP